MRGSTYTPLSTLSLKDVEVDAVELRPQEALFPEIGVYGHGKRCRESQFRTIMTSCVGGLPIDATEARRPVLNKPPKVASLRKRCPNTVGMANAATSARKTTELNARSTKDRWTLSFEGYIELGCLSTKSTKA